MESLQPPTVDVQAPNGRRVVLRPVIAEGWIPRTSRGGLAVAVVLCATWLATGVNRLNHTDLWGHLSFGRWIVEHRALPQSDPFRVLRRPRAVSQRPLAEPSPRLSLVSAPWERKGWCWPMRC